MFKFHHLILFLIITYSDIIDGAIVDESYLNKNGPFGLITFEKNDTFVDWVRVPEASYQKWISTLKIWRTCSIVLGILCLILAALVLAYIIYGFNTDSSGPFDCWGETRMDEGFLFSDGNLPMNLQQLALQHQLKQAEQREQEAQREKLEAARRLSAIIRHSTAPPRLTTQLPLKTSLK